MVLCARVCEESFACVRLQLPDLNSTIAKAISDQQSKQDERNIARAALFDSLRNDELVDAARALLEAREDQMVTQAEWDRLREAVEATQA